MNPMKWALSSKIQKATVMRADPEYVGSITVDEDLMDRAGLWAGERVMVVSSTTGARLETYVITGERGGGDICLNGPAALLIKQGEIVTIMGFTLSDRPIIAKNVLLGRNNRFVRFIHEKERGKVDEFPVANPV
jgi:aspartate 1-decarboxylase